MNLFDLKKGQKCLIDRISSQAPMRRRLLDIGLISNTPVQCVEISPGGDPKAFLIRDAVIALRQEDCQHILIKDLVL